MDVNTVDLDELSLSELKTLQKRVEKSVEGFEERKKKQAVAELQETASRMGFTFSELKEILDSKPKRSVAPKYANPKDPTQTWSGRGRKPHWVLEALEEGKTMDDLAISAS
ncbi:H-NS histone family protein [Rhodobacteraceae bacterium]|nr:H-NS histone family protein [Paracoccaceae bacterium]